MSVTRSRNTKPTAGRKPRYVTLRPGTIEKVFTDCVMDLKKVVVLDGIDILPDGFRVRRHDLHGPLPERLRTVATSSWTKIGWELRPAS